MNDKNFKKSYESPTWNNDVCDKYDFLISVFSGAIAGIVDVVFVGSPLDTKLGKVTDYATDEIVKNFAKINGWSPKVGNENNVGSAIGFLERNFVVNYENSTTASVEDRFQMMTTNHHYKSLSHSPDIIGLFFSILDQFTGKGSFLSDGQLIRIDTSGSKFELRGENFVAKLFCGFCNWIGHIMSDISGSSGSRGKGMTGRGSGLPIPFSNLFLLCDFGKFQVGQDKQTLAVIMTRAFQEGYDARFGASMAIPVLLEELMIRVIWSIKRHYYAKKDWQECIPTKEYGDLRLMLIVGNSTLCLVDGIDASVRSGGNAVSFILHMNLMAWSRLVLLILKELYLRYGDNISQIAMEFISSFSNSEKYTLDQYYRRMENFKENLDVALQELIIQIEKEYQEFALEVDKSLLLASGTGNQRLQNSARFAQDQGVSQHRIIHSADELDDWIKK